MPEDLIDHEQVGEQRTKVDAGVEIVNDLRADRSARQRQTNRGLGPPRVFAKNIDEGPAGRPHAGGETTRRVGSSPGYGTADLGLIAYESEAQEGLILDEGIIVELVHPGTGDPVEDEEIGEVVVTTLNPDYPLIRFGTGDLSAILQGASPCGRTNRRIKGWLGRADQTTKVKGMFVHPEQIVETVRRHKEIGRARLVVGNDGQSDVMTLKAEVCAGADAALAARIAETLAAITKLKGTIELVPLGSLPKDGKLIDDIRKYD